VISHVLTGLHRQYIDRKHGLCGFWGSQLAPFGYSVSSRLHAKLQKEVFAAATQ
jgi:hypothetical protein